MTNRVITLIAGIVVLSSTSLQAQDYTLSHLTNDTGSTSISGVNLTPTPVEVGQLPASYLILAETDATLASEEVMPASHGATNLAELVGFVALLALGGTITSLCVYARRKPSRAAPVNIARA